MKDGVNPKTGIIQYTVRYLRMSRRMSLFYCWTNNCLAKAPADPRALLPPPTAWAGRWRDSVTRRRNSVLVSARPLALGPFRTVVEVELRRTGRRPVVPPGSHRRLKKYRTFPGGRVTAVLYSIPTRCACSLPCRLFHCRLLRPASSIWCEDPRYPYRARTVYRSIAPAPPFEHSTWWDCLLRVEGSWPAV